MIKKWNFSPVVTWAGRQGEKYKNRIKHCECNNKIDRDINGSRNILIKNIRKILC